MLPGCTGLERTNNGELQWCNVRFSDEVRFCLHHIDGHRKEICHRPGEEQQEKESNKRHLSRWQHYSVGRYPHGRYQYQGKKHHVFKSIEILIQTSTLMKWLIPLSCPMLIKQGSSSSSSRIMLDPIQLELFKPFCSKWDYGDGVASFITGHQSHCTLLECVEEGSV